MIGERVDRFCITDVVASGGMGTVYGAVHETLGQGLHGWEGTDGTVTMTHSGYWARQSHAHAVFDKSMSSTAGDFRNLTPLVLMTALAQAGTRVHEPVHRFRLEVPTDTLGPVWPVLARLRAVPRVTAPRDSSYLLEGEVPAARVHELEQQLPALTRGEDDGIGLRPLPGRSAGPSRPGRGPTTTAQTARTTPPRPAAGRGRLGRPWRWHRRASTVRITPGG